MVKVLVGAVAALSFLGCDVAGDVDIESEREQVKVATHTMTADSVPESALILVVPAANVAGYVPAGFDLVVIPGAADGADGALLWVFAGAQASITLDGVPVGDDHLVHTAVQIQEPPAPPGKTIAPGASHLYEIRLVFDSHDTASFGHAKVGEPTVFSGNVQYAQQDPGLSGPGFVSVDVGGEVGGFSFHAEYGPLAPFPPPLAYTWYVGDHGLVLSEAVFANLMASGAGGAICADAGSWMGQILGLACRGGGGLALTSHTTLTWTTYFPEDD